MKKILSAVLACAATMSLATCAFADDAPAAEPGATEQAAATIEAKVTVGTDGIGGAALEEKVLVKDGKKYAWTEVDEVTFSADGLFSVQFAADKDKAGVEVFTLGKDAVPAATVDAPAAREDEAAGEWNTSWTLDAELIALFAAKPDVKLVAKEADTEITVGVTLKADATGTDVDDDNKGDDNNQPTGIALAVAPAALAVAFVTVAAVMSKKKKD